MSLPIRIKDYAGIIKLYEPYSPPLLQDITDTKEQLVDAILFELNEVTNSAYDVKRRLQRGKLNTLPPNVFSYTATHKLNCLLQLELKEINTSDEQLLSALKSKTISNTKLVVWQGDITTLKVDAIVNAANNQLLGCWQPLHACIDNAIHSAAGVQLRNDCNSIMQKQGFVEPTGTAKITRAYNLPSNYVIHTVGPIVQHEVTELSRTHLMSSYTSCLDIAHEMENIQSIAFCGISTGVFGYPAKQAAKVALDTVKHWLENNTTHLNLVIFNVFSANDYLIYNELIQNL